MITPLLTPFFYVVVCSIAALLLLSVFLSLFRVRASLTLRGLRAAHAIQYFTMVNNNTNNSTNCVSGRSFVSDEDFVVTIFGRQNMSKLVHTMTTVVSGRPASPPIHTRLSDTKYFDRTLQQDLVFACVGL